jgi:hypothetical protein
MLGRWNKPPRFVCASPFEMEDVTYKRDGEGRQKICVNGREYKDWSDLWWSEEHA